MRICTASLARLSCASAAPPRPNRAFGLEDREPVGHDRYADDHWSGQLTFTLTAVTPLLIPDSAKARGNEGEHQTYPLRIGSNGKPLLPVTTVKGMLRTAFETVTNSRFGVFDKHDRRLGFRRETEAGAHLVPARIEIVSGVKRVRLLPGDLLPGSDGSPPLHGGDNMPQQYAAWLKRYESPGTPPPKGTQRVQRSRHTLRRSLFGSLPSRLDTRRRADRMSSIETATK